MVTILIQQFNDLSCPIVVVAVNLEEVVPIKTEIVHDWIKVNNSEQLF